ncbi:MAG: cation transporter [Fimbriimonadaceae bacterium]|nr:cation transporter [Fimbriimonadaceae bacterium]
MKTVVSYIGTAVAALAASACCWIPALLGAGAAGSLGISAALAPWRPYLLVLTGLFLTAGFWMVYRRPKSDCCDSGGCATPAARTRRRINIGVMWSIAAFSLAMAAYPEVQAMRSRASHAAEAPVMAAASREVVLAVKGMDCEACAAPIEENLKQVPGVVFARVDYPKARAVVGLGRPEPTQAALIEAVKKSGFEATVTKL